MNKYLANLILVGIIVCISHTSINATEREEEERQAMKVIQITDIKSSKLPEIIKNYIEASNSHDVKSILACFTENAVVHDEKRDFSGKRAIEEWLTSTIKKYSFQFKPLTIKGSDPEKIVTIEVSGTFDGSPIILNYHFMIENEKLASLNIG